MKYFSALIKPASSLCNLKCEYCFYHDVANHRKCFSHDIMNEEVMKAIIDRVFDYFQEETQITFAFQGGEPTLAGITYFEQFIDYVNQRKQAYHTVLYSIQTNGLGLNEGWFNFFLKNQFLVGVSLDGFEENHNALRGQNFAIVLKQVKEMERLGISVNILTVLTHQLADYGKELFAFYKENDLKFVQLIPCLPQLNQSSLYALTPHDYLKIMNSLFEAWFLELRQGNYFSINTFDHWIFLFKGMSPHQCGSLGFCTMQFVIESNGDVYPCDFYCLDEFLVGNVLIHGIRELISSVHLKRFLTEKKRMFKGCASCRYCNLCNGNCKRMNVCFFDEKFCAIQEFLKCHEREFVMIARRVEG